MRSRDGSVSCNESTQPLREAVLSNVSKGVKDAEIAKLNSGEWLVEQTTLAAQNLKSRPIERRGPYTLSDDDLNQKFELS
jgi:hypothetical protein